MLELACIGFSRKWEKINENLVSSIEIVSGSLTNARHLAGRRTSAHCVI